MNKLIFLVFSCIGIQIEAGFSMMDTDSSPVPHKKLLVGDLSHHPLYLKKSQLVVKNIPLRMRGLCFMILRGVCIIMEKISQKLLRKIMKIDLFLKKQTKE